MRKRRLGLSLIETMVVVGLFSMIGVAMISFYRSASVEFEAGSQRMTTSQHGRQCLDQITSLVCTAVPRRPLGVPDAFYRPDMSELLQELEYIDFVSNQKFLETQAASTEFVYAFDKALPAPGYTNLYRYRIAWTPTSTSFAPANSVYLERLDLNALAPTVLNFGGDPNNPCRRILARDIFSCRFRRTTFSSLQCTINVYGEDPNTGRQIDGTMSRGLNRQRRQVVFQLTTALPMPALTL